MRRWIQARKVLASVLALVVVIGLAALWTERPRQRPASTSGPERPAQPVRKVATSPSVPLATGADRPNIMMVMTDDMRWDELKYLPNTRKYLQQRGLRYTDMFAPNPLCCPARSSILTGKYSHNHGVLSHIAPYGFGAIDDSHTIAGALQQAGYRTALIGKYLNGYGVMPSKVTGKSSIKYVPAGWTDWMAGLDTIWGRGSPNEGNTYDYFSMTQNINGTVVPHHGEYSSDLVASETSGLVEKYAKESAAPWFMWVTPVAPHFGSPAEPDDPPNPVTRRGFRYELGTPARPSWVKGRFDSEITHAPGTRVHGPSEADVSDKPENIAKWPEATPAENTAIRDSERQRAEALYAWDADFGKIVRTLKRTGQYDKTLILFTSDNGYYTGEHRQRQGKIKPHEPVIRLPLLIAGPGVPHGVRQAPVFTFDLTATILAIAGASMPGLDGESKADTIYGPDRGWTYPMVLEGLIQGVSTTQPGFTPGGLTDIGIRTGRWKYVRYANGDQELYDLDADPLELTSLIGDPKYAEVQSELSELWAQYRDCAGAACRKALPADLQVGVEGLAAQNANNEQAIRAYYDD